MKLMKKTMPLLLIVSLSISLGACGKEQPVSKEEAPVTVVTDAENRTVEKPENMDKLAITCYGGASHELVVLGASEKIVAQPDMSRFPQLSKMFPAFQNVVDPGSFDDVNVEELLKVSPDMVFVGITSKKGNKLIEEAGLPTYTMLIGSAVIDSLKKEFEMTGILLDNEEKSEELINYWNTKMEMVEQIVGQVPEAEKKSVFYTSTAVTSANTGEWGNSLILGSGGINVTGELTKGAAGSEVGIEQILQWNPDVIVIQKTDKGISEIMNDERIKDLEAIKNEQVYQFPIGAFWWDRPSPEAPLGFIWLAKTLYPEYTKELDLKKETVEFYKEFYQYELSDEEYESFF